jgi:hypothetical protein
MRGKQLVVAAGVAALTMSLIGTSTARPQAKKATSARVLFATEGFAQIPRILVDSEGTVNAVWLDAATGSTVVQYARRPVGAKHFTRVALPSNPPGADSPFIYSPSHGVLQILEDANEQLTAWRSTNDGTSWRTVNLSSLEAQSSYHIYTDEMNDSPGGPVVYAGTANQFDGPVVQLNSALTSATQVGSNEGSLQDPRVARSSAGTTYQMDWGTVQASVRYQAGASTGTLTFPTCPASGSNDARLGITAGKTVGVVVETACGHTWAYTISPTGAVGKLQTLGSAIRLGPTKPGGLSVSVVADRNGHFTAAWVNSIGDLSVSRSTDGTHWTPSPGAVPIAYPTPNDTSIESLSTGAATWNIGSESLGDGKPYAIRGIPLSSSYKPPPAPSGRGISHPKRGRLGPLATTVPGRVALKHWHKTGQLTFRVVDEVADHLGVSVADIRTLRGGKTAVECAGRKSLTLKARQVATVTVTCARVHAKTGRATAAVPVKKGDLVRLRLTGRNGTLTVTSKVA